MRVGIKEIPQLLIRYKNTRQIKNREDVQWFFGGLDAKPEHILDVCSGIGMWGSYYQRITDYNFKYVGLDIDKERVNFSNKYHKYLGLKDAYFIEHDINYTFPFADETFDMVWLFNWYQEPFFNREQIFKEINRLLKPNDTFLFHMPYKGHKCKHLDTTHEQLVKLLDVSGFELLGTKTFRAWACPYEFYFWGVKSKKYNNTI